MAYGWVDVGGVDNVLKNHSFSDKIREQAIAETVIFPFAIPEQIIGKNQGETGNIIRINQGDEPVDARFVEPDRIPESPFSFGLSQITVEQRGRQIPYTSLAQDLSKVDITNNVQKVLKRQLKLVLDKEAGQKFLETKIKYAPTGASTATITTNGTFGATATNNMNFYHTAAIRDYMYKTLKVPMLEGDHYIGIFDTEGLRGLKEDSQFIAWHQYTTPEKKFKSEVGVLEQIRFVECNHTEVLDTVGTGGVLGRGFVFGDDAVIYNSVISPELRVQKSLHFGLDKAIAWYGLYGFAIVWPTGNAGEAKIVEVGSA